MRLIQEWKFLKYFENIVHYEIATLKIPVRREVSRHDLPKLLSSIRNPFIDHSVPPEVNIDKFPPLSPGLCEAENVGGSDLCFVSQIAESQSNNYY